jgi:hypothetical protein
MTLFKCEKPVFSMSEQLEGKEFFFFPTMDYTQCQLCGAYCEVQLDYYGNYMEGPGLIVFPDRPMEARCPHCLGLLNTFRDPQWYLTCAVLQCKGHEVTRDDDHHPILKRIVAEPPKGLPSNESVTHSTGIWIGIMKTAPRLLTEPLKCGCGLSSETSSGHGLTNAELIERMDRTKQIGDAIAHHYRLEREIFEGELAKAGRDNVVSKATQFITLSEEGFFKKIFGRQPILDDNFEEIGAF